MERDFPAIPKQGCTQGLNRLVETGEGRGRRAGAVGVVGVRSDGQHTFIQ